MRSASALRKTPRACSSSPPIQSSRKPSARKPSACSRSGPNPIPADQLTGHWRPACRNAIRRLSVPPSPPPCPSLLNQQGFVLTAALGLVGQYQVEIDGLDRHALWKFSSTMPSCPPRPAATALSLAHREQTRRTSAAILTKVVRDPSDEVALTALAAIAKLSPEAALPALEAAVEFQQGRPRRNGPGKCSPPFPAKRWTPFSSKNSTICALPTAFPRPPSSSPRPPPNAPVRPSPALSPPLKNPSPKARTRSPSGTSPSKAAIPEAGARPLRLPPRQRVHALPPRRRRSRRRR